MGYTFQSGLDKIGRVITSGRLADYVKRGSGLYNDIKNDISNPAMGKKHKRKHHKKHYKKSTPHMGKKRRHRKRK